MTQAFFVAGTDTGVGKTYTICALLHRIRREGLTALGLKPVASGVDANGQNEDVEAIRAASSLALPEATLNSYLFPLAIAPHIAAEEAKRTICFAPIIEALADAKTLAGENGVVLVEGVGGFRVPLGCDGDSADLAVKLGLPVILVVGMRLGCINHALLTMDAIFARGLLLAGWVANTMVTPQNPNTLPTSPCRTDSAISGQSHTLSSLSPCGRGCPEGAGEGASLYPSPPTPTAVCKTTQGEVGAKREASSQELNQNRSSVVSGSSSRPGTLGSHHAPEEMPYFAENVATLRESIPAPLLGVLPVGVSGEPAGAAEYLSLPF